MRWAGGRPPLETRPEKSLGGGGRASEQRAGGGRGRPVAGGACGPPGGKEPGEGAAAGRERRCPLPLPATPEPAATVSALQGWGRARSGVERRRPRAPVVAWTARDREGGVAGRVRGGRY